MIFRFGLKLETGILGNYFNHQPRWILTGFPVVKSTKISITRNIHSFSNTINKSQPTKPSTVQHKPRGKPKKSIARYTTEEDALIINLRAQRIGWRGIQTSLPHRSVHSLRHRWEHYLRPGSDFEEERLVHPYTISEEEKIRQLRQSGLTWSQIQRDYFPQRGLTGLRTHFNEGMRTSNRSDDPPTPWTVEEQKELFRLKHELRLPWADVFVRFPNRTITALRSKYRMIQPGARQKKRMDYYSAAEDATIRSLKSQGMTWRKISEHIPGRSAYSVRVRHQNMAAANAGGYVMNRK